MINTTPPAPPSTTLSPAQLQKYQKAATDFESMAINQLLTPIFNTVDQSKSMFGGGEGEDAWKPMMVTAIAKQMTAQGGLGLAQPIMQQMIRMQEHAK
jgi:flagellar protein FlgJ